MRYLAVGSKLTEHLSQFVLLHNFAWARELFAMPLWQPGTLVQWVMCEITCLLGQGYFGLVNHHVVLKIHPKGGNGGHNSVIGQIK